MNEKILNYLNNIESKRRRDDCLHLFELINSTLKIDPKLWDDKNIGYGDYHYVNKTNEGDMFILGFVPAKAHVTLYFAVQGLDPYQDYLDRLGKHKCGKVCLYLTNLEKIDLLVLIELIKVYYDDAINKKNADQ